MQIFRARTKVLFFGLRKAFYPRLHATASRIIWLAATHMRMSPLGRVAVRVFRESMTNGGSAEADPPFASIAGHVIATLLDLDPVLGLIGRILGDIDRQNAVFVLSFDGGLVYIADIIASAAR